MDSPTHYMHWTGADRVHVHAYVAAALFEEVDTGGQSREWQLRCARGISERWQKCPCCTSKEGWLALALSERQSRGRHLVGKAPEEQRDDDGAPQLGHDVEQAVRPVAHDGDGAGEARAPLLEQLGAELCTRGR